MQGKHSGFPWQCAVPPGEGATDSHPGFVEHTHPLSHLAVDGDGAAAVLSVVSLFGSELRGGGIERLLCYLSLCCRSLRRSAGILCHHDFAASVVVSSCAPSVVAAVLC
mmetsp:Transcript_17978/g.52561  ORF Transcript_17978/g.52561 Transcript_17978/m.52561 type:complete len:109 (+) Transcript_17978:913-1239(+)